MATTYTFGNGLIDSFEVSVVHRFPRHLCSSTLLVYIRVFGHTYVIMYFDRIFVLVGCLTPSQTSLNRILWLPIITHIILEIELFTSLNSFAGAVKTKKFTGVPFLFKLVAVVS